MRKRLHFVRLEAERLYKSPAFAILQTRLPIVLMLAALGKTFDHPAPIAKMILVYMLLMAAFAIFAAAKTEGRGKRYRALRDLIDLVAIAGLVHWTGGSNSPWFLLFFFPLMSSSRYLGVAWSLTAAAFAALSYACASGIFQAGASTNFLFRAFMFFAVTLTAANLRKARDWAETELLTAIEGIDRKILSHAGLQEVMDLIVHAAMMRTNSDLAALILVDGENTLGSYHAVDTRRKDIAFARGRDGAEALRILNEELGLPTTRSPVALPAGNIFAANFRRLGSKTSSSNWRARLVQLEIGSKRIAMIGVFSHDRLHYYSQNDVRALLRMAPVVARALASLDAENTERLRVLYDIGKELKIEQGLDRLFQTVVALVSFRIRSEEAALIVPDESERRQKLRKAAVFGPDKEVTDLLLKVEGHYSSEPSLTQQVFQEKKSIRENEIPPQEYCARHYSSVLPSRAVKHYMGVPLIIGDDVLGVIRVLNKKALTYSPHVGKANLIEEGFSQDDLDLLTMIATQVAAAIRNAMFIEKNRHFRNLVDNSPDPTIVVDKRGRILHFNHECARLWNKSEKDALGTSVKGYYESPAMAIAIGKMLKEKPEHRIMNHPARIRDAQGVVIPIRLAASLLFDGEGKPAGSIGVFTDERETIRQEEEKIRAEKLAALGKLAHATGHDIKNQLGAILMNLERLKELPNLRVQKAYISIREAAKYAFDEVQNMLMTAKPSEPQMEVVYLMSWLREFEEAVRNRVAGSQVVFTVKGPEDDVLILADKGQMRQVVRNFLSNSLDAIQMARAANGQPFPGQISVAVETGPDQIEMCWRDNGIGMTEEARANAFIPLFSTKETGSGLGLYISRSILRKHGGEIVLEPANGPGVCFQIKLPCYRAEAPQKPPLPAKTAQQEPRS